MKLTFDYIVGENHKDDWLRACIIESITADIIDDAKEKDKTIDIKLLINGVELEPAPLIRLLNNIEHYIRDEAKKMIKEKLQKVLQKVEVLYNIVNDASKQTIRSFNLDEEDYDYIDPEDY